MTTMPRPPTSPPSSITTVLSERKRPEDAACHITVSDPVQHSEGMNKYTSYRVDVRGEIGQVLAAAAASVMTTTTATTTTASTATAAGGGGAQGGAHPTAGAATYANIPNNNTPMMINTDFRSPHHTAVLRRYSDFHWLYQQLRIERPGTILPPLPDKQVVARFNRAFVEDRRRNLEIFVRRVAIHPEVCDSLALQTFLRADDALFRSAKKGFMEQYQHQQQQQQQLQHGSGGAGYYGGGDDDYSISGSSTAGGGGAFGSPYRSNKKSSPSVGGGASGAIKQWFAEAKTTALLTVGLSENHVHSPDDDIFMDIDSYIRGLDEQMKSVLSQSSALVRKGREMSNGLYEFGAAFAMLAQSEAADDHHYAAATAAAAAASSVSGGGGGGANIATSAFPIGPTGVTNSTTTSTSGLGAALAKMGEASDALSNLSSELAESEETYLEHPLTDYVRTISSVRAALKQRSEKRMAYTAALTDVDSKRHAADKVRGVPGKEERAIAANAAFAQSQEMANVAREEFATVSQRVLREVDRFKREKAGEIRRTVMDYITLQIEYNRRVEAIWDGVIPHLERVTVAGGGGGGVSSGAAGDRGGDGGNGSADDDEDDKNEGGEDFGGGDGTFVSGAGKAGVAAPRPNIIGV